MSFPSCVFFTLIVYQDVRLGKGEMIGQVNANDAQR